MIPGAATTAYERIRTGESAGQNWQDDWETVYRAVWPVLCAHAAKRCPPQFAADVAQKVLLVMLERSIQQFATLDEFLAFSSRAASNLAIDTMRRTLRFEPLEEYDPADGAKLGRDLILELAPADLSDEQAELLRLFYVEGRTYREIADLLGRPQNVVKNGMYQLQTLLEERRKKSDGKF